MTGLQTWRDDSGTPDLTTWVYHQATGLLTRKEYADQQGTDYSYHDSGQLHQRTWARGTITTYAYDNRGMPTGVTYSDGTPSISYQYNRAGRLVLLQDAAGTHSYDHMPDGQMATETITGSGLLAGHTITNAYGTAGHGLRDAVTIADGTATLVTNTYGYDPATGRLATVTGAPGTATYGYQADTDWQSSLAWTAGPAPFTRRTHRDVGGRVTSVVTRSGTRSGTTTANPILASAGYLLDSKGRREALTREDGTRWEFSYNERDEVTSGVKRETAASQNLLAGRQFAYQYDDIGNRLAASYGGDPQGGGLRTMTYTPNALNQYDTITHPGVVDVLGWSQESGTITATPDQQGATTVQNGYWRAAVQADNSTSGQWTDVSVERDDAGNIIPIDTGKLWVPPANLSPVHDADGNLLYDGRWDYQWNGENRLVRMTTAATAQAGGHPWMQLEFTYDATGRRIRKTVETGTPAAPVTTVDRIYLYDGWNLLAEIERAPGATITRTTYQWGTDLSGTLQGAGGVGGLLSVTKHQAQSTTHFFPTYDGNGNIIAWLNDTATVVERIDYDAFGNVQTRIGEVEGLAIGFSTKYTDEETGLCYYGYRYYDPLTGRWPSRDPIEENGGINLYAFVGNDGVNKIDQFGLEESGKNNSEKCPCDCLEFQLVEREGMFDTPTLKDYDELLRRGGKGNNPYRNSEKYKLPVNGGKLPVGTNAVKMSIEWVVTSEVKNDAKCDKYRNSESQSVATVTITPFSPDGWRGDRTGWPRRWSGQIGTGGYPIVHEPIRGVSPVTPGHRSLPIMSGWPTISPVYTPPRSSGIKVENPLVLPGSDPRIHYRLEIEVEEEVCYKSEFEISKSRDIKSLK